MEFLIEEVAIQQRHYRENSENEVMYLSSGLTALKVLQLNSFLFS